MLTLNLETFDVKINCYLKSLKGKRVNEDLGKWPNVIAMYNESSLRFDRIRDREAGDNAIAIPSIRLYWQIGSNAALTVQKIRTGSGLR